MANTNVSAYAALPTLNGCHFSGLLRSCFCSFDENGNKTTQHRDFTIQNRTNKSLLREKWRDPILLDSCCCCCCLVLVVFDTIHQINPQRFLFYNSCTTTTQNHISQQNPQFKSNQFDAYCMEFYFTQSFVLPILTHFYKTIYNSFLFIPSQIYDCNTILTLLYIGTS